MSISRFPYVLAPFQCIIVLVFIFLFSGVCVAQQVKITPAAVIRIVVQSTATVYSDRILLKDIARIEAEGFLKEALGKIDLGISPKPEQIKVLEPGKIIADIRSKTFLPENVQISVPERVYVKQPGQKISKARIQKEVVKILEKELYGRKFKITAFQVRGLETYPAGKLRFNTQDNGLIKGRGRLSVLMTVFVDGTVVDKLNVSGQVEVYENVLFAKHFLPRGTKISETDVVFRQQNIFGLGKDYLVRLDDLEHQVTRTGIRKDACLKPGDFETPPLIRKGDVISLVSRKHNSLIVTSAISKEDGFINKVIRVENLDSGKQVQGVVTGKSKVEVRF